MYARAYSESATPCEHGEQAADEHGEEVVDPCAPAPEPIESLNLECRRHEQRYHGQAVEILRERRLCFRDRDEVDEPTVEANEVGQQESGRLRTKDPRSRSRRRAGGCSV
jgi:hypothetical protein